jgi:hypothetical protein
MKYQPGTVLFEHDRITLFIPAGSPLPQVIHLVVEFGGNAGDMVAYHRDDTTTGVWVPEKEEPKEVLQPFRSSFMGDDNLDEIFEGKNMRPCVPSRYEGWATWTYETATRTGTICSVCKGPQVKSPGGHTCELGHGGADPATCPTCGAAMVSDVYGAHCSKICPAKCSICERLLVQRGQEVCCPHCDPS